MLKSLSVSGYRSIEKIENLELGNLNVLIGPNGVGKSNFLSIFRLLSYMLSGGGLQHFVSFSGGSDDLLHGGNRQTNTMSFDFTFTTDRGMNEYSFILEYGKGSRLFFAQEQFRFLPEGVDNSRWTSLGSGHEESKLIERADSEQPTAQFILSFMRQLKLFQFHNTSVRAGMRQPQPTDETLYLREDGSNIAPLLFHLQTNYPRHYRRLVGTLQVVWPQLADFLLEPENDRLYLRWLEKSSDKSFGAHLASDGTLRLICLLFLLMQPKERRPAVLILDEPELGLHPAAIGVVAGRIGAAALEGTQIILATQSPLFLDYFSPDDVIVMDRKDHATSAHRMSSERLKIWMDEYTLSDIWQKNVDGGNP